MAQESRRVDRQQPSGDGLRRLAGEKEKLADRVDALAREMEAVGRNLERDARQALDGAVGRLASEGVSDRIRESAADLRRLETGDAPGDTDGAPAPNPEGPATVGARRPETSSDTPTMDDLVQRDDALAQTLEEVARQVERAGTGEADPSRALSDELRRLGDARRRLAALQAELDALKQASLDGPNAPGSPASDPRPGESRGTGDRADSAAERIAALEEAYRQQLDETLQLLDELEGDGATPGSGRSTPEGQRASLSAPGTEAFKQDFAAWDELRREVAMSLERLEASVSGRLQAQDTDDRLNAGGDQRAPGDYRLLVSKYYEALAARKPD
jgi:hypothetical protein